MIKNGKKYKFIRFLLFAIIYRNAKFSDETKQTTVVLEVLPRTECVHYNGHLYKTESED